MTEEQKRQRAFFTEKIAKKLTWTEADTEKMLDLIDPVWPNSTPQEEARHHAQRVLDFTKEFTEWEARQPKVEEKPKPMTDEEVEALAQMF